MAAPLSLPTPHDRQHKLLYVVLIFTALTLVTTGVIFFIGLPRIIATDTNADSINRGIAIQGCRASYSAEVTDATTRGNQIILAGLEAIALKDTAGLADLTTVNPVLGYSPVQKARADIESSTARYRAAVQESVLHPDAFLAACARRWQ